jgi:trimeric autotransporter adhesin
MPSRLFVLLVFTALLFGCGGSSSHPVTLNSVTIAPLSRSIAPGTTELFFANTTDSNGAGSDVTASATWISSNPAVATVSNLPGSQGHVAGVSPGSATISASFGGFTGTATVTVSPVASITVAPGSPTVSLVGSSQQFSATAALQNGAQQNLTGQATWASSNEAVAGINSAGLATTRSAGTTNITASFGGVTGAPVPLEAATLQAIAITPAAPSLDAGAPQQFSATGTLSNGDSPNVTNRVTWSSSDGSVVSINLNGLAQAKLPGTATISAAFAGTPSGTTAVTVLPPTSIAISPANLSAVSGTTEQFTATGSFADGSSRDITGLVTWNSSVTGAASFNNNVSPKGLATIGTNTAPTVISATLGATSGSTSLTVKTLTSLAITPNPGPVTLGSTLQLRVTGTFSDASTQDLTGSATWSSSNTGIAPVSNIAGTKGLVHGLSAGSASISASVGALSATDSVTVSATPGTPPTNRAYVTNSGLNTLSVIDTTTNALTGSLVLVGTQPQRVALNTSTSRAYVTNNGSDNVSVIDLTRNVVVATVVVGSGPVGIAVAPSTNRAYVVNNLGGTLSVINTSTNTVITTIDVGASPEGVAVNASGSRVYVANGGDNTITIINGSTNIVLSTVNAGGASPRDIVLNAAGSSAYIANSGSNNVTVLNTATNQVAATVSVGSGPRRLAIDAVNSRLYVANGGSNSVSVLSTATNAVVSTVPVGNAPQGMATRPATSRFYVVNNGSNTVTVLNATNNALLAGIAMAAGPTDIAVLP